MKIFYLGIWRNENNKDVAEVVSALDLSTFSRWNRGSVTEMIRAGARIVAERTKPGSRAMIPDEDKGYVMYVDCREPGICAFAITDLEYPEPAGKCAVFQVADEYTAIPSSPPKADSPQPNEDGIIEWRGLDNMLVLFQDPTKADKMSQIQSELDETKFILHKTIESVLERGEKLDSLVAKSDELSATSRMFYSTAKKQNSCCIVM